MSRHMTFRRFGRSHHLEIRSADDLAQVPDLDETHWVATNCPTRTMNCDAVLLALLDGDGNGRIMCFELRRAIEWLFRVLKDTTGVTEGSTSLRLDAINDHEDQGRRALESARKMLDRLGLPDENEITLGQVRQICSAVESTPVSEAGVALPEASQDADVRQFLADVVATVGGAGHPSGQAGVSAETLDAFLAQARAYLDWRAKGLVPEGASRTPVMPLGAPTPDAFALLVGLRTKVDQYFAQCQVVAFDPRTAGRVGVNEAELSSLDGDDPKAIEEFIRTSPLSKPRADRVLDFDEDINPVYAAGIERLRSEVVQPALGEPAPRMTRAQWQQVKQFFAAHEQWAGDKAGQAVEPLGAEMLQRYLGDRFRYAATGLIAESTETAFVLDNIRLTEKLLLFQANLIDVANNFVSFPHLYDPSRRAMFEMGTLIMDGRRFSFSIRVDDRKLHSVVAKTGNLFVLYVEVLPAGDEKKFEIAVPVTSGGKGNLCVGKRGVFQDTAGREFDARVVQVIENPISVGEALVSPFQRLGKLLGGKIEKITATAEKKLDVAATGAMDQVKGAPAGQKAQNKGLLAGGLLMGGGVAVAALGTAFAYVAKTLTGVPWWQILLGVALAVLAVILPTSIIAMVKLRKRDLSAVLEGSEWGINAQMRLTSKLGRFFTQRPRFPKGARGVRRRWLTWLLLGLILIAAIVLTWQYVNRP